MCVGDHPNEDFERKIEKVYLFCAKYVGDMLEPLSLNMGNKKKEKQQSYLIMRILQERNLYLHGDYLCTVTQVWRLVKLLHGIQIHY